MLEKIISRDLGQRRSSLLLIPCLVQEWKSDRREVTVSTFVAVRCAHLLVSGTSRFITMIFQSQIREVKPILTSWDIITSIHLRSLKAREVVCTAPVQV